MFKIDKKGYTLIELLLALGIIAILVVIIFFTYSRVTVNNNTKTEVENIAKYYAIYEQHANAKVLSKAFEDATNGARYDEEKKGFLTIFQMQDVVSNGELDPSGSAILGVNKFQGIVEVSALGFLMGNIPAGACDQMVKHWYSIVETPKEDRENTCYTESSSNNNLMIYFDVGAKTATVMEDPGPNGSGGGSVAS